MVFLNSCSPLSINVKRMMTLIPRDDLSRRDASYALVSYHAPWKFGDEHSSGRVIEVHCRFHPRRQKWIAGVKFNRLEEDQSRHIADYLRLQLFEKKMSQMV